MLKIAVITLFPEMFTALTQEGVCAKAFQKGHVELTCINPRDYTDDKHRTVDDRPFGGGPGMVMKYAPLALAVDALKAKGFSKAKVVYLSPQGAVFKQEIAEQTSRLSQLILICGRYEGIDERFVESYVDEEWSIGDYVLSGGELGAMVVMDSLIRLLPNVLGHERSAVEDSFSLQTCTLDSAQDSAKDSTKKENTEQAQRLLDHPHYTRPEVIDGQCVPTVLLSGNHKEIAKWRLQQRLKRTQSRRPELLKKSPEVHYD